MRHEESWPVFSPPSLFSSLPPPLDTTLPETDSARFSLIRSALAPLTTWEEEGTEGVLSLLEELIKVGR